MIVTVMVVGGLRIAECQCGWGSINKVPAVCPKCGESPTEFILVDSETGRSTRWKPDNASTENRPLRMDR
jgi:hypothetical protein